MNEGKWVIYMNAENRTHVIRITMVKKVGLGKTSDSALPHPREFVCKFKPLVSQNHKRNQLHRNLRR